MKKSNASGEVFSGEVFPVECDLRREGDIMALFQSIRDKYGRLDVCINNAGVSWQNTLSEGKPEEWKEMLDVSVFHNNTHIVSGVICKGVCNSTCMYN